MDNENTIMEARGLSVLYGGPYNRAKAVTMLKSGGSKHDVFEETGITVALWDASFQVRRGEIFVVIGLSGSGKSTLIRCFNRLLSPTFGHVYFNGRALDEMGQKELLEFRRTRVSMIFQHFGLLTHRSVINNVAYGLEVRGVPEKERKEKAMEYILMVGLDGYADKPIDSLSGGMKQRVGIARAICSDPEVILMDEPFSALDPLVRRDIQFEFLQIQRKLSKTVIFITHDINEAFKLGDRVAIMRDGKIIQIDTPEGMSKAPADEYVRSFIEGADRSKVLTVKNIMITPASLVKKGDYPANALREMRSGNLSSTYVVDGRMRLLGVIPLEGAIRSIRENIPLSQVIDRSPVTVHEDTLICDVLPLVAGCRYPIGVVDSDGALKGIVSKAAVLSSML